MKETTTPRADAVWKAFYELGSPPQHLRDELREMERGLTAYIEGWRVDKQKMMDAQIERDDWRRCAEALAYSLAQARGCHGMNAAMDEFDRLKGKPGT